MTARAGLLTPRAREIGQRLRQEEWYQILSTAPHHGARKLAAALLLGELRGALKAEDAAKEAPP